MRNFFKRIGAVTKICQQGARGRSNLLRLAVLVLVSVLIVSAAFLFIAGREVRNRPTVERRLPADVEMVVNDFNFQHEWEKGRIEINGKRIVRRGRRFLAVRSNVLKTNLFTDITGSYASRRTTMIFRAKHAEWDMSIGKPLRLSRNLLLTVNGRVYEGFDLAEIFFEKGIIELHGKRSITVDI